LTLAIETQAAERPTGLQAIAEVVAAAAALVVAQIALKTIPFARIAREVERPLDFQTGAATERAAVSRIGWAIGVARRRLPWRPACLCAAVAASRLLARQGVPSEIWIGARESDEEPFAAHAWLIANGRVVTGGTEKPNCRPIHTLATKA
jgi:hypothetical protein